jgi:hypothetical protein
MYASAKSAIISAAPARFAPVKIAPAR